MQCKDNKSNEENISNCCHCKPSSGIRTLIAGAHYNLVNADLGDGVKRTGQYSCDKCLAAIVFLPVRDHGAVVWADPYGSSLAEDDVGTSKGSTLRRYSPGEDWEKGGEGIELQMEVGVVLTPSTYPKECVATPDDENGGRGENNLKTVIVLGVTDVVEIGSSSAMTSQLRMTGRRRRNTILCDPYSRSVFSFTPAKIVPCGDRSETGELLLQGDALMSQVVRTDQISLDTVSSRRCPHPGMNLISETDDLIKIFLFCGVREPVSQRDTEQINGGGIGESQSHIWREEGRKDGKDTTASAAMMFKRKSLRNSIRGHLVLFVIFG
ncbi:hypothetical protein EDD85DRAFT_791032 [Armillaria nabsnona]|nr:hypothetical protein EDD85DRAFT_791032 [Armillaria nabsnona]